MTGSPLTAAALLAAAVATVAIGAYGVRLSRTTSDFLVASRSVGPQWNAAAISGEYLSAASFLGVAGLIAKYGADALWYPVGFTAGYLGLLLFVAAPLRRSGAYTVPDFAEFRLGSVRLRKVAMLVVVVICVFYLVPQYQGAGLALKTLLGVPVWIGPLVVGGIVITNVVAGGMRSITFVQAFQYWLKLTAIAIPALALLRLFFTDRGELGGPMPPTVQQHTTVAIETDVVVHVAEPAGITVTGTLDGIHVGAQPIPSEGDHTLGAGTTLTLAVSSGYVTHISTRFLPQSRFTVEVQESTMSQAETAVSGQEYLAVQASPEFQELRNRLRRFVFPMSALFLIWYFAYVLLGAFAHDFMAIKVWGNINVGLLIGLGQFVSTFVITAIYVRFANRELDPRAEAIRAKLEGGAA